MRFSRSNVRGLHAAALVVWLFCFGCSSGDAPKPKLFSPPQSFGGSGTAVSARSPSAMEAMSRGLAAVTPPGAALNPAHADGTLLGKRYGDEDLGLEILCTKAGEGSLSIGNVPLPVKGAKPLPSSD